MYNRFFTLKCKANQKADFSVRRKNASSGFLFLKCYTQPKEFKLCKIKEAQNGFQHF